MGDKTRGLYDKFTVRRVDGSDAPGGKHDGCKYFVLDRTHDKHAAAALAAYAASCEAEYPLLAADLKLEAAGVPSPPPQDEAIKYWRNVDALFQAGGIDDPAFLFGMVEAQHAEYQRLKALSSPPDNKT